MVNLARQLLFYFGKPLRQWIFNTFENCLNNGFSSATAFLFWKTTLILFLENCFFFFWLPDWNKLDSLFFIFWKTAPTVDLGRQLLELSLFCFWALTFLFWKTAFFYFVKLRGLSLFFFVKQLGLTSSEIYWNGESTLTFVLQHGKVAVVDHDRKVIIASVNGKYALTAVFGKGAVEWRNWHKPAQFSKIETFAVKKSSVT